MSWNAQDGIVITIRAISAADLALEEEFVNGLSSRTGYQRLMSARRPSHEELVRFTNVDCEREVALIATAHTGGHERQIGVARYVKEGADGEAEFAIVLSDDWQGRGLGSALLEALIAGARRHRVLRLSGMTLSTNEGMLALGRKLGFKVASDPGSATVKILTLDLSG